MSLDQLAQTPPAPLPDRLRNLLVGPDDPTWDIARRAWNLTVDQQPAAVATPDSAEDVVDIVNWARQQGLRIAAQGTGHSAAALTPLGNAVLVKTVGSGGVQIDAERRRARVGAGVLWGEVSEAAGEHGLAALAGSAAGVGVVGYTLGGGLSWLARRYGLAANSVIAIELVTADGRHLRVDRNDKPDLFWALRGGGGAFGVVTALELELYPVAEVYAGTLFWPIDQAGRVLDAWRTWSEAVPPETTSCGRLLNLPPFPDIPEPLRGRSFVAIEVAHIGSEAEGAVELRALRALGPEIDTVAAIPAAALGLLHMDPEGPVAGGRRRPAARRAPVGSGRRARRSGRCRNARSPLLPSRPPAGRRARHGRTRRRRARLV